MASLSNNKRGFGRKPKAAVSPDMNVTPLVDVVLVLLIIFMVLAPVVNAHYLGRLPPPDDKDQQLAEANPDNKPLVMRVTERELADGQIEPVFSVGAIELEHNDAPDRLGRLLAGRADKVIYVDAADSTDYGYVLQGMSFAKDAEDVVNDLVREQAREAGQDAAAVASLRVTAVLVTTEIPVD
ncbi:Biopolymer transport protein ExbD/TolR [Enhygromyxa salina]|uniref:Biopolymer transport protein ExbD/TolR n=1 Tax=Enhygromyxa salina TaxID=215803 RepID=A0A0C1Z7G7_9BACT|nr:biopolymer transporter ExbD [Enhygromyxa salina]KIG13589.1 Biopolymer transport protein ExbD/TolR [Enhygromyxa salina]